MSSKWITVEPVRYPKRDYCFYQCLPRIGACYVIYLDGQLSYIGQAADLKSRITGHWFNRLENGLIHTKWGDFEHVLLKYRPCRRYGDWAMVELRLIRRLGPQMNRVQFAQGAKVNA